MPLHGGTVGAAPIPPMHTRCPRCQFDFDAAAPWVHCPRCAHPFAASPLPPAGVVGTQALDPALLANVQRASAHPQHPPYTPPPAWQPPRAAARSFVADEDLAGRAVISVVLSIVSLLGGCNPVGLVGVTLGLMAYAAANDQRDELARSRGRTARRVAWVSMLLTVIVWVVVVLSLFYELA